MPGSILRVLQILNNLILFLKKISIFADEETEVCITLLIRGQVGFEPREAGYRFCAHSHCIIYVYMCELNPEPMVLTHFPMLDQPITHSMP